MLAEKKNPRTNGLSIYRVTPDRVGDDTKDNEV